MKKALLIITILVGLISCSKEVNKPNPQFFDGTQLNYSVLKSTIIKPSDSLTAGMIQVQVNGTSGNGEVLTAQVFFQDVNHVAFNLEIKAVDLNAHDYFFTVQVPAGVNQYDTVFQASDRIQVIGLSKITY